MSIATREDDRDIPNWLRWAFISINRVGFPILVSLLLFWYLVTSQKNLADSLNKNSLILESAVLTMNVNHAEGKEWRNQMMENIRELRTRIDKL